MTKVKSKLSKGRTNEEQRKRLIRAQTRHDMSRIVAVAGISENTLWKALAGGPLYNGTWAAIERGLNELEK